MDELRIILSKLIDLPSPTAPFTWGLLAALVFARSMDFLSTWIVTPKLVLEANALMRRTRWRWMLLLNLPLLGLPFLHHGLTITFAVTSILVAGSNLANGALAAGMGEAGQLRAQQDALRNMGLAAALSMNSGGMLLVSAGGGFLMALTPGRADLAWWGGLGVVMFGITGLVHLNTALVRMDQHRRRREASARKAKRQAWRDSEATLR